MNTPVLNFIAQQKHVHLLDVGNFLGTRQELINMPCDSLFQRHRSQVIRQLIRLNAYAQQLGIDVVQEAEKSF